MFREFDGMPRNVLESVARKARERAEALEQDVAELTKTLTIVQAKCTEQLLEIRALKGLKTD